MHIAIATNDLGGEGIELAFETFSLLVSYDTNGVLRGGWFWDVGPITVDPVLRVEVGEA